MGLIQNVIDSLQVNPPTKEDLFGYSFFFNVILSVGLP